MTAFERVKYYFDKGWASTDKVRLYVQYGVITAVEFETITGEVY